MPIHPNSCDIYIADFTRLTGTYWLHARVPLRRFRDKPERPHDFKSIQILGLAPWEVGQLLGGN